MLTNLCDMLPAGITQQFQEEDKKNEATHDTANERIGACLGIKTRDTQAWTSGAQKNGTEDETEENESENDAGHRNVHGFKGKGKSKDKGKPFNGYRDFCCTWRHKFIPGTEGKEKPRES